LSERSQQIGLLGWLFYSALRGGSLFYSFHDYWNEYIDQGHGAPGHVQALNVRGRAAFYSQAFKI